MTHALRWTASAEDIAFEVEPAAAVETWPGLNIRSSVGSASDVGALLQLLDEGTAKQIPNGISVPHKAVAELSEVAARGLGLPPRCPHTLLVETGRFNITQPEFKFVAAFRSASGERLDSFTQNGSLCEIDGRRVRLPEPQFSILEAVRGFNEAAPSPGTTVLRPELIQTRLFQLATLRSLLGRSSDEVKGDDYLASFQVVVPNAFTLALSRNTEGDLQIAPELHVSDIEPADGSDGILGAMPLAKQREFQTLFGKNNRARPSYTLGAGWFVALPRQVEEALRVVREVQDAEPSLKNEFAKNPRAFLRQRLETFTDEELEEVFVDDDYGERVRGVGLWEPKVLAWMEKSPSPWLPSAGGGLIVGSSQLKIIPEELDGFIATVNDAIGAGVPSVRKSGLEVPATLETAHALQQLKVAFAPPPLSESEVTGESFRPEPGDKHVLLIKDNLEDETFSGRKNRRGGDKSIPARLQTSMLPHQQVALDWLQSHWLEGSSGALLADDMGLGKTLEALAFLAWLQEQMELKRWARQPLLIVAPTGLLRNWRDEIEKHLRGGGLGDLLLAWGSGLAALRESKGRDIEHGLAMLNQSRLEQAEVVLTTYETLRDYQHSFAKVGWCAAIFDEAQKIKNPEALMTDASKAVAAKAAFAVVMTGTPVENRPSDLWCILDAAQPAVLGPLKEFAKKYEGTGEEPAAKRRELKKWLVAGDGSFPSPMLRRMKGEHLKGLPKLHWSRPIVEMPSAQAAAYSAVVAGATDGNQQAGSMLRVLHQMRSVSLHPAEDPSMDTEIFISNSARLIKTMEILDEVHRAGEKALLFVEARELQPTLMQFIQRRYDMRAAPLIINGSVPGDRRKARVDEFQQRKGFDVMLLSPRAGGVGLTLTAANHVIHLTRWWNPAVEDQCTDRVNRIGQRREVHVWAPLARHPIYGDESFDVLLDALLERKRRQSEDTLTPPEASEGELSEIFSRATKLA